MRDRLPTPGKENRVKITQDDGTVVEGVLSYADDATQEGSPYTKGNVLSDDVCNVYNLDKVTSEPKDAFLAIPGILGKALLSITVTKINGQPYPGVLVNGLSGVDAPRRTTNDEGKVVIFVDAGTYNLSFQPNPSCIDTSIPSKSVTIAAGGSANVTTQETSNGLSSFDVTSTRTIAFSAKVQNLDAFLVGGGGGACGNPLGRSVSTGGGGGGYTKTIKNITFNPYTLYAATIGAGGSGGTENAYDGGTTQMFNTSANGGKRGKSSLSSLSDNCTDGGAGGSGGGGGSRLQESNYGSGGSDGGNGNAGYQNTTSGRKQTSNGGTGQGTTTRAFEEPYGEIYAGGGAGGRNTEKAPGGGGSGAAAAGNGGNGDPNTGGGGGGVFAGGYSGGNGGSGIIKLRWVNAS